MEENRALLCRIGSGGCVIGTNTGDDFQLCSAVIGSESN